MKKLYRITKNRSNMKTQKKNLLKNDLLQRPGKKKKQPWNLQKVWESWSLRNMKQKAKIAEMKKDDMEKGSEVRKDCSGGGQ